MRRIVFVLTAVVALSGVVAYIAPASGQADGEALRSSESRFPPGYRDWRLISVAHEEGNLSDLRAILGNDVAIRTSRKGKLPYPDGTIIARPASPRRGRHAPRPSTLTIRSLCSRSSKIFQPRSTT